MARNLTSFTFYKNTPLTDLKNTIYFESNEERDTFFIKNYETLEVEQPFNFIKDRFTLRLKGDYNDFKSINYCSFISNFETGLRYYCFIPEYEYINDETIELNLLVDGIMTFCQGDVLNNLEGLTVSRQHLTNEDYQENLEYIKTNDDVIKTTTKKYFYDEKQQFQDFNVLVHSSVSLNGKFGTQDNPILNSATGSKFDTISSPVDLYIIKEKEFTNVMKALSEYPWITQNFTKIILIPKEIIDIDEPTIETEPVQNDDVYLDDVLKITGGTTKTFPDYFDSLNLSNGELLELFDLTVEDEHLFRNEYATIELYNWNGDQVLVDCGQLNRDTGVHFEIVAVGGYSNEMAVYLRNYKSRKDRTSSYLNDALFFRDFDDVPILIDNYGLAMSQNANQREVTESNLMTGKIKRALGPNDDLQDRLASSVGILTNLHPLTMGQSLVDEHEFYRRQKAEQMDLALSSPTITNQSTNYSLNRRNFVFGVTMKMSKPNNKELDKIKKYYKLFGFELDEGGTKLSDTRSMTICNYLEFEGTFNLPNVERSIEDIIKIQFENGIRLWHNNNTANPFNQDTLENKRRV